MVARVCVVSQKGGVGKTTVAVNLAVALAEAGQPTLLVDLDPQGGVGHSLARPDTELVGLVEVLMARSRLDEAVLETRLSTLSLLSRGRLDPLDVPEFESAIGASQVLGELLDQLGSRFRRVIIDCPSGFGAITRKALAAAGFALVPVLTEHLTLRSLDQLVRVVDGVRAAENPSLELLGFLPTMVDKTSDHALSVLKQLWTGYRVTLDTTIPRAEVFAVASRKGLPISFLGGRISPEGRRFAMLAAEVEHRIAVIRAEEGHDDGREERTLL